MYAEPSFIILNVLPEFPERAAFEIGQILVVGEGFALEANISVRGVMIAVLNQPNQVFDTIPHIERNNAQFGLLTQVNTLVVEQGKAGVRVPH